MKIIEAMKRVKLNNEKVADLRAKIGQNSAHLSYETPLYGDRQRQQVSEWVQACLDISQENVRLLVSIQRTNLATSVTVELGGKQVTKTIAEWVWRRRAYAEQDRATIAMLTDRSLKEGVVPSTTGGEPQTVKIIRNYDPASRDEALLMFRAEPHLIDSALEIINATTDLVE